MDNVGIVVADLPAAIALFRANGVARGAGVAVAKPRPAAYAQVRQARY
jgi:hypothetical protein